MKDNTTRNIAKLLGTGKAHAKHLAELSNITGYDPITLKSIIKKERIAGALIVSDESGYYMAANRSEIAHFVDWIEKQALSRQTTLKHFRAALKAIDGQQELLISGTEKI